MRHGSYFKINLKTNKMKLKRVTITGADDSIAPAELIELSKKYPFVEWGLLASKTQQGGKRFPSRAWLDKLNELLTDGAKINLSLHLCGKYVHSILQGRINFTNDLGDICDAIKRIQINTHGDKHGFDILALVPIVAQHNHIEFIFQYDQENTELFNIVSDQRPNVSALFDLSHGGGVLPKKWPEHLGRVRCGYAGGLSPDNIHAQLDRIAEVAGDNDVWVDVETHVRSGLGGANFDLEKVVQFLEACKNSQYFDNDAN